MVKVIIVKTAFNCKSKKIEDYHTGYDIKCLRYGKIGIIREVSAIGLEL
jgi:hypothetical protein